MILKSFQLNNLDINKGNNFILFYGENKGFKEEETKKIIEKNKDRTVQTFDEKEILDKIEMFYETVYSKSLFEEKKIIRINRTTDKLFSVIETLLNKDFSDITIIFNSDSLEKKSKIRSIFEKNKKMLCIPFYPDNQQTLSKIAQNFISKNNIKISYENINIITDKCNGDRGILKNELNKIKLFGNNGKIISKENLLALINLIENHSMSELADNFFIHNKKKIIKILNENNYSSEDCIAIIRILLIKSKKILNLSKEFEINKDIDLTIASSKPPIFWKDKEIIKEQIYKWNSRSIRQLIYKLSEIEFLLKKNFSNSLSILFDFILNEPYSKINNSI